MIIVDRLVKLIDLKEKTEFVMKKLHRSVTNRIIGGVCGGIAETYGIDATFIRLLFAIITLFYGTGLLIYIILMLILPVDEGYIPLNKADNDDKPTAQTIYRLRKGSMIAGVCSGLADVTKLDVSLLRVLTVVVTVFTSGIPILLYLILWIILPYKDR